MSSLLEIDNLSISFAKDEKKVFAVQGISFNLSQGETLGIVGESGSGKTTAAKCITGLLSPRNTRIQSGKILYRGEDLLRKNERQMQKIRGREISMIFQDPMTSLNPTMRIGAQVIEGYAFHNPKATKIERFEHAVDLLQRVGVSDAHTRMNQFPHELSGGMRQRIMIAIAMISSPNLLIADEPTTALDVTIQAQILKVLKETQEKDGTSIILITHNLSIVSSFCDRVIVMYAGKIVENAPVEKLFTEPKHPYTRRLIQSIPRLDLQSSKELYSIKGSPPNLLDKKKYCAFSNRCPHFMNICKKSPPNTYLFEDNHSASCWLYHSKFQKTGGPK